MDKRIWKWRVKKDKKETNRSNFFWKEVKKEFWRLSKITRPTINLFTFYSIYFENNNDVFVPPNPNEFDKAAKISFFFVSLRIISFSLSFWNSSSSSEKFKFGGICPCVKNKKTFFMERMVAIASTEPDAPKRWPIDPLILDTWIFWW